MPIPDFFDCLMAEGLETARQMAAIAESHAMVMAQHLATLEKTIEAARGYRGEQKKFAVALAELASGTKSANDFRGPDRAFGKSVVEQAQDSIIRADRAVEQVSNTLRDKILDRYGATGDDYQIMAYEHGLIPASVNQWLKDARDRGDNRAAAGDLLKLNREEEEEANLRAEFRLEGTSKTRILFPEDDAIGTHLATLNPATGEVFTDWGTAVVAPYWIDTIACLNDQREVPGSDLVKAGKFSSELALLRELRTINEKLAEAKLYILADSAHYQLCRLL